MKNKRILIAVVSIICAAIIAVTAIVTQKVSLGNKTEVVVVTSPIKKGEKISAGKVKLEKRTTAETVETAVDKTEKVVNGYAVSDMYPNDIVTYQKFSPKPVNGDSLIATMSDKKIAISIPVEGAMGVNGKLESGDIVQAYYNNPDLEKVKPEDRGNMPAKVLCNELQYIKILSISFSNITEEGTKADGNTYSVVTFECSPTQVSKLLEVSERGLHLGYICHGNDERAPKLLKAQEDLNTKIQNA